MMIKVNELFIVKANKYHNSVFDVLNKKGELRLLVLNLFQ
jgi:hypothetical protein